MLSVVRQNKLSQTASSRYFLHIEEQRTHDSQKISAHTDQTQKLMSAAADKEINCCSVNAKRIITFIT